MNDQKAGHIINVGSIVGWLSFPYQTLYSATKSAVRGFTEGLRRELEVERSPIHVTLISPGSTSTPFFEHARNKMGPRPRPLPPSYEPQVVADNIVFACENPRPEIVVGAPSKAFTLLERLWPTLIDWMLLPGQTGKTSQLTDKPDDGKDNLFGPTDSPYQVRSDPGCTSFPASPYTSLVERHPLVKAALVGTAAVGVFALLHSLSSGRTSE